MGLNSTEFGLLSDIASGIRQAGRPSGNTVPLSVYNELLGRYNGETGVSQALRADLEKWKDYGNRMSADFDKLAAWGNEWQSYAQSQKARAERAEAELARLRGHVGPKAA